MRVNAFKIVMLFYKLYGESYYRLSNNKNRTIRAWMRGIHVKDLLTSI